MAHALTYALTYALRMHMAPVQERAAQSERKQEGRVSSASSAPN